MFHKTLPDCFFKSVAKLCQTRGDLQSAFLQTQDLFAPVIVERFGKQIMQSNLFALRPPEIFNNAANQVVLAVIKQAREQAILIAPNVFDRGAHVSTQILRATRYDASCEFLIQ
jgi:hypothetical protein